MTISGNGADRSACCRSLIGTIVASSSDILPILSSASRLIDVSQVIFYIIFPMICLAFRFSVKEDLREILRLGEYFSNQRHAVVLLFL